jgi:hypothetical protein
MNTEVKSKMVAIAVPEELELRGSEHLVCVPASVADEGRDETVDGYLAISKHRSERAALTAAAGTDGAVVAAFHYRVAPDLVLIAQRAEYGNAELLVMESCDTEDVTDTLGDVSCERYGLYNNNGEGYDGLCGNCADSAWANNEWDDNPDYEEG